MGVKPPKVPSPSEDQIQLAVVEWLTLQQNMGRLRFFHTPNGGKRDKITAARLKRLGVRAGVPDLCVLSWDGDVLWIEMKADKGRATDNQLDWIAWLNSHGHRAVICHTSDVAIAYCKDLIRAQ